MNPLFLLMGLLALSYFGTLLVGDRRLRGFGLPSGVEYVILGFALGPGALGLVDGTMLATFDPIAHIGLGWVAFGLGLGFGAHGTRKASPLQWIGGGVASLVTAAGVAAPLWLAVTRLSDLRGEPRILLVGGAALACAETTHESVRWVTERYGAKGPLSAMVSVIAETDHVVPLLGLAIFFSLGVTAHLSWPMTPARWALATLGLGAVCGGTAALMIGPELRPDETWGTLLGVSILGTGVSALLGLSTLSAMFVMGLALGAFSGQRDGLLLMIDPAERAVLHPLLLLAGAHIDVHAAPFLPFLALIALAARALSKSLIGASWQVVSPPARKAGPLLGAGLLSAGTLCITIGLAFSLRFPGAVGGSILAIAAACTLVGELVGPFSLRASLLAAGEIAPSTEQT